MKESFVNSVKLDIPLKYLFEVECRYDKEWKTNFITLASTEIHPTEKSAHIVSEEMTICINNKKEADKLIQAIKRAMKNIK